MEFDKDKLDADLAKMDPDERVKRLKQLEEEAKKKLQETEFMLKHSQELIKKNKQTMLQQAIQEGEKLFHDRKEKERLESQKEELSRIFEEKKDKEDLERSLSDVRLPETHPIVGLYNQLQDIRYNYSGEDIFGYASERIPKIREELIEMLNQYKQVPEAMKEIADASYRLTKDLLGDRAADIKGKYFP
ncbi:hypothetical protein COV16_05100 [Candidatus Woesearchaeota archaeon CG10_big_fil_rev_8_21_14_0_10_34_8]|nr:MAG: hypothetical protein COV16_05100 [Candidatus Woesearchaeota archaeon CG10_big_fil_rev_8_21_14_0_10_34_8]